MAQPDTITINGNTFVIADLSEAARTQIGNIQAADAEIARLSVQLGLAKTARNAYAGVLAQELPASVQAPAADGAAELDTAA